PVLRRDVAGDRERHRQRKRDDADDQRRHQVGAKILHPVALAKARAQPEREKIFSAVCQRQLLFHGIRQLFGITERPAYHRRSLAPVSQVVTSLLYCAVPAMFHRGELTIATKGRGTYDITREVASIAGASTARNGLATVFIHHTSASLIICEDADPSVRRDLEAFAAKLVPDGDRMFTHDAEGDDDMPAHIRTILTQTSIGIPV